MQTVNHTLTIDQQKKITATGIDAVLAFSETKLTLSVGGKKLYVAGSGLKIIVFSKTDGNFCAEGEITGVSYGGKSFAAKLFK